jgi:hypothetical protein
VDFGKVGLRCVEGVVDGVSEWVSEVVWHV